MNIIRTVNFRRRTYFNPDHPIVIRKIINAGLGQLVQQMINNGPWGIVSAHNDVELRDFLRGHGIGFIMMKGAWVEDEIGKFIRDGSLLLPCVDESLVKAIAQKYGQRFYIFARNGKFQIKNTKDGEVINDGNAKALFNQFYRHGDELQFGNSITDGRPWILDYRLSARSNLVADEINAEQNEHVMDEVKLKLRIVKSSCAFIAWVKRPKYVTFEGIVRDVGTPPGSRLLAYLPLG